MIRRMSTKGKSFSPLSNSVLPISGIPSSSRTLVNVANHNGVMNIGADNMHLKPVGLYHGAASAEGLEDGGLPPRERGSLGPKGTPARYQPAEFGAGSPQVTPEPEAAMLYGGSKNPPENLKIYAVFANAFASWKINQALKEKASNEYVAYSDKGMNFSSLNALALGGGDKRALQFTEMAHDSKEFIVQYREANQVERSELFEAMKMAARSMKLEGGKLRGADGSANAILNEQIGTNHVDE